MGIFDKIGETLKKFSSPVVDTSLVRHRSRNIIGFYSPAENSGTTSLLCNIAEYLQGPQSPTVIVDLNLESPACYKYFIDAIEDNRSMLNKIRNRSMSTFEVVSGNTDAFGIVSMSGYEHPSDYCEIPDIVIESILMELSSHYKYVLVDLGTSLNADATIQGILTCNKVYSVVRPVNIQVAKLMATKEHIENVGHYNKIKDVVQTMILGNAYSTGDFEEYGFNLVGNVALDMELMIAADNGKFATASGKSKNIARYVELIKALGEDIKHTVATTTLVDESTYEEAAGNADSTGDDDSLLED